MKKNMRHGNLRLFFIIIFIFFYSFESQTVPIEGYAVKLQFLDKITSQIKSIEINVNNTHEYGTLKIEIYACYKRPPEEIPEDFVLLKIFDTLKENNLERIYQGWMISSSPAATPIEHPIYDVWVKECKIY